MADLPYLSARASPTIIENVGEEADDSLLQLHWQKVLGQRGEAAGRQVSLTKDFLVV